LSPYSGQDLQDLNKKKIYLCVLCALAVNIKIIIYGDRLPHLSPKPPVP
jgi:hypothetical protein